MSSSGRGTIWPVTDRNIFKYFIMTKVKAFIFSQARAKDGLGRWESKSLSFFLTPEVTLCLSFLILGCEKSNKLTGILLTTDVWDCYTLRLGKSLQLKTCVKLWLFQQWVYGSGCVATLNSGSMYCAHVHIQAYVYVEGWSWRRRCLDELP